MVDPFVLFQTLNQHVSLVSSLGRYETVSRQQATDAKGLVHCLPLLEALLDLSPTGEIHPGPLRQALLKLVQHKPKINTTDFNGMVYCNMRAERVTTVLLHLRRLKSEEELAKVAAKVSGKEYQLLKELAQNLAGKDTEQNSDEEREAASLDKRGQQEEEEAGPLAKRRQLKKEDSAISMDSSGFPKCLQSPQQSNALPLEASPDTKDAQAKTEPVKEEEGIKLKEGIKTLFDDRWDVIQECGQWGIECFAIVPWWNAHGWGMNTYPSFDEAAIVLKDSLTKDESAKLWSKHKTYLKGKEEEKEAHEQLGKKEKGLEVVLWFLKHKKGVFFHTETSKEASETLTKGEKWVSEHKMLQDFSKDEFEQHLASGRVKWRSDPWTPGIYQYCDQGDLTKQVQLKKKHKVTVGQEREMDDAEDEKEFMSYWGKGSLASMQEAEVAFKGQGPALTKGKGQGALTKGKGSRGSKGRGRGVLAIEDGNPNDTEDDKDKKTPEEQWAECLTKAQKSKEHLRVAVGNLEEALEAASQAGRTSKQDRGHGLELAKLETEPLTKGDGEQSVLAQTLLSLWSHGQGLAKRQVQDPETTIPIFIHADGVEFQSRAEVTGLCFGPFKGAKKCTAMFFTCPIGIPTTAAMLVMPSLTIRMVRQDGLHVLFVKGVCSHLLGSLLHHVCYNQGRGKQNKQPSQRLALIFSKIQENYKELQTPTRLTNLRLSMICDPSKPHQEYAKLEAKGAETKHLLSAFLPVLKSILEPNNTLHQHMVGALEAMVDLVAAFDAAGLFPCPKEFQAMQDLDQRFCRHYTELNKWAQKNDHKLYHIVYKHHCQHHLVKEAQFLNPRYTWNFRSEDFVGRVATLARSLAMGVKSTRLSGKLMIKYRILLHMQLTRLGFDLGVSPDSDGEEW
ncbi:unnamed protein product [Cladocopium goreaui]|uniref:Uncharacterized protein n=1 Tax=Cladocopium goreaui TaxID=2562237 RepID=A0A9P1DLK9_9DINO|nr:unnamed protein product [Cladocopium goreaui]